MYCWTRLKFLTISNNYIEWKRHENFSIFVQTKKVYVRCYSHSGVNSRSIIRTYLLDYRSEELTFAAQNQSILPVRFQCSQCLVYTFGIIVCLYQKSFSVGSSNSGHCKIFIYKNLVFVEGHLEKNVLSSN